MEEMSNTSKIKWSYFVCFIGFLTIIFAPCLANLSPYMLANYDVKCDKKMINV